MKFVFVGSSLHGYPIGDSDIVRFPPASQGDILAAVRNGAAAIGLVDGQFEGVASVWHKEILYALSLGVHVLGASSIGALRAAECETFGMVPVGAIARSYAAGILDDDAAVALVSGPAELDYLPLSEPLVDALATIDSLGKNGLISAVEQRALIASAHRLFFKDRTAHSIVIGAALGERETTVRELYRTMHVSQKTVDALELLVMLGKTPAHRRSPPAWTLRHSPFFAPYLRSQCDELAFD